MIPVHYSLIKGGTNGRLLADVTFRTGIVGYRVSYDCDSVRADLYSDGRLVVYQHTVWDFGTMAVNTPAMVVASLEHDVLCHLTNARLLPWSVRMQADKKFFSRLGQHGATVSRFWRTPAVMLYSQLIARWKDKH